MPCANGGCTRVWYQDGKVRRIIMLIVSREATDQRTGVDPAMRRGAHVLYLSQA